MPGNHSVCKVHAGFFIFLFLETKEAVEVTEASEVIMSVEGLKVIEASEVFRTTQSLKINTIKDRITLF